MHAMLEQIKPALERAEPNLTTLLARFKTVTAACNKHNKISLLEAWSVQEVSSAASRSAAHEEKECHAHICGCKQ
jgi:hypothetical protein